VARAIVHPSDMLAALVALAEERGIGWDRLIESAGLAYEVMCRMADQADLRQHGFDGSTLSPIAAAAGAAWLLGLDEKASGQALRIAALDAGTLRAVRLGRLSDWKAIASGRGALKGLFAARMAEVGCISPDNVFGGDEGFLSTISGPLDIDAEGGSRMTRVILKAHPAQIFIQGMLQLAEELRPQLAGKAGNIQSISVGTFKQAVEMVGGKGHRPGTPMNRETADHSAAFAIAAIFTAGKLGHDDFERLLADPGVMALIDKTRVEEDSAATKAFPRTFPTTIRVTLDDGAVFMAEQDNPVALKPADLAIKFAELWPRHLPRQWRWELPGTAPHFPVGNTD
jgi:2-methylcitrate dehydratase